MREQPFSFWCSKHSTTYTELQRFCKEHYCTQGPALVREVHAKLEAYAQADNVQQTLQILHELDEASLTLSCLNAAWIDFSVAVFEVYVLPSKAFTVNARDYLRGIFNSTLKRIANAGINQ